MSLNRHSRAYTATGTATQKRLRNFIRSQTNAGKTGWGVNHPLLSCEIVNV